MSFNLFAVLAFVLLRGIDAAPYCGFPLDIRPNPFPPPTQECDQFATTPSVCVNSQFYSGYECYWDVDRCTSDADLTGEDPTCPVITDQQSCENADPWFGARDCVWWVPTMAPSLMPSSSPSQSPTFSPSFAPSVSPHPSGEPSLPPSSSAVPSVSPSRLPSKSPSREPSLSPSLQPSTEPSTSSKPSAQPSVSPSREPSWQPSGLPSSNPSLEPSASIEPSASPSWAPSWSPTAKPTLTPTLPPTPLPSAVLSARPSAFPSLTPSDSPSRSPSGSPSHAPSARPSSKPSETISGSPTYRATSSPSFSPSTGPSFIPSFSSESPSSSPSISAGPSHRPSTSPSDLRTEIPSHFPSGSPSDLPTERPSFAPSKLKIVGDETAEPTLSTAPSLSPSTAPSAWTFPPVLVDPKKFDWDLERIADAVVVFNEESDSEEIMLYYNMSLREYAVTIFHIDCSTPVSSSVIGVNSTLTPNSTTHGVLEVDLDVVQSQIIDSTVWSSSPEGLVGYIDICIRVDLLLPIADVTRSATVVNFDETKLALTIDLTQGFEMIIDLNRTAAAEIEENVKVDYTVIACQCDEDENCVDQIITPGQSAFVCLYTTSKDIQFVSIERLTMTQNDIEWFPVLDGQEDDLTGVTLEGDKCVVRTQMASLFFEEDDPENVVIDGVALLAFGPSGESNTPPGGARSRALLVESKIVERGLQQDGESTFQLEVGLASSGASSAISKTLTFLSLTGVFGVSILLC